jgi:hypothetical protein
MSEERPNRYSDPGRRKERFFLVIAGVLALVLAADLLWSWLT